MTQRYTTNIRCNNAKLKWCLKHEAVQNFGTPAQRLTPSDGHFLLIVPLNVVLIACLKGLWFSPTSHLTDANTGKCYVLVASRSRGSKSVSVDAETATSSPLSSLLSTPTVYSHILFPLSSAIWLPERVRHHFCNGAAGICSRRCRLVLCSAGRQATTEERMSHSGTQRNLKAWRSGGVEWPPRQPGAGNLSSASVFNL